MKRRMIILGGGDWIFEHTRRLDVQVLHVQQPHKVRQSDLSAVSQTLVTDYCVDQQLIPILKAIHAAQPFDVCLSLTEAGLIPSARVNEALNLPGLPLEVVERVVDKSKMRSHLERCGFESIRRIVASNAQDVMEFAESVGGPVIAKQIDGLGSRNVRLIHQREDAQVALSQNGAAMQIEEYLQGREFSVEAFSFDGHHVMFGVGETKTLEDRGSYVGISHVYPAALPDESMRQIHQYVDQFLTCMGISQGPSHTELRLTANGPRILETHTRLGGHHIPQLIKLVTGVDMYEYCVAWPLSLITTPVAPVTCARSAAIHSIVAQKGKLLAIHGLERLRGDPNVFRVLLHSQPDVQVPCLTEPDCRIGDIITIADSSEKAYQLALEAVQSLEIEVAT
jgi:biotin carboxylase